MNATFELALSAVTGGTLAALVEAHSILSRDLPLPRRYWSPAYYLVRGAIIILAGTLPCVFGLHDLRYAFALGAVAPTVVAHFPKVVMARWLAYCAHEMEHGAEHAQEKHPTPPPLKTRSARSRTHQPVP